MRVITAKVNGIRASVRRGGLAWLLGQQPDVLCLQEVRASDTDLLKALADAGFGDWEVAHAECSAKGRAGVAVATRATHAGQRVGIDDLFVEQGRWVEVDLATAAGPLTVVSAYVPTGEAETKRQVEKYAFLDAMTARMERGAAADDLVLITGTSTSPTGGPTSRTGRATSRSRLPRRRAPLLRPVVRGRAWVDVHRGFAGDGPAPYTWWSWRGKAFDNDAGWRIDYQLASRRLAARALGASVCRAATYAERWSDHAPVLVDYDL